MSEFNNDYEFQSSTARRSSKRSSDGDVSPLSSRKVSLAGDNNSSHRDSTNSPSSGVKSSYRGFHHAFGGEIHPPLLHPIKPRGKRSIFGKFISSIDKSLRNSTELSMSELGGDGSRISRSSKTTRSSRPSSKGPSSRSTPGLTSTGAESPRREEIGATEISRASSTSMGTVTLPSALNVKDLGDMSGIVAVETEFVNNGAKESWRAPESWDVKNEKIEQVESDEDDYYVIRKRYTTVPQIDENQVQKKSCHIRIYAEDDDFASTLKRPYNETVEELIKYLKGRYSLIGDYKMSLRVGKVTKKLEWSQRPIKIQTNLLLLSGYAASDRLDEIGRDDLSYLFKFILHHDVLKQLSPAEEEFISRDLVHVNLKSKDLQKIPALCYSSKVQSLDVSNNGDITLPSDFFQTGNSQLSSLRMVNIRTKVFPPNIIYARELVSLDLERNFISMIPDNIHLLKNLSILNLRCNKINTLPELPSTLKILDLSSNEFETYPESVNKLVNLLQLDISYNKIRKLPSSIENLKSIKKINLSSNDLTVVDINLTNLRTLNLKNNKIIEINLHECNIENLYITSNNISNIANPLNSLKVIDLHQNPITQLNFISQNLSSLTLSNAKLTSLPKIILSLHKLERLDLSRNGLRVLPDISNLINLKDISIFSNNLEILPDLSLLKKLKVLDVHDNNLKSISDISFIENVNLSSNLISELPLSNHDNLLVLRAGDNLLDDQCFYSFKNLANLKVLALAYNKIIDIPLGTISQCRSLDQLYLSGNALSSLPDDFESIVTLRVLCLNGNRFRTLPSDLSQLRGLEVVDVGSNELKYNTSNSRYEWNWKYNVNLRYLNLSGNKKLEITEDLNLPKLKVLGLMDLTLTTQAIPDESMEVRVRTTPSQLGAMSYGISDRVNKQVVARDSVYEKIKGGVLIGLFDGFSSGKISYIIRENFHKIFEKQLEKEDIASSLRNTFLSLNRVIYQANLSSEDSLTGSGATVAYIKDNRIYTANIGDTAAMLAKTDGSFTFLTVDHNPSSPVEFERIRTSGGFVSNNDKLDGVSKVSRAAGFSDLLPHIHAGPDISEANFHDEVLVIGTKELFDYLPNKTIGDIVRENDNPMITAETLRDYAISYGCDEKCTAIVLSTLKTRKKTQPLARQHVEDSNLRRLKPEIDPPTGELAMVFTDIKNSTLLWENYPLAMRSAIRTHNEIMRRQLHIVGGYEVKTEGDAFMVSFPTVTSAMVWCFNVQQQLLQQDWPAEILSSEEGREFKDSNGNIIYKGLSVRMGIHWGVPVCEPDIITRRMDYFGPMVNKTARVCAVADGGEITLTFDCLSEFKRIESAYKLIQSGASTVLEAFGDGELSETLETEISNLENIGWRIQLLGKVQLKGLETEEEISLLFPKPLESRLGFQRKQDLTTEDLFRVRELTTRLEHIISRVYGYNTGILQVRKNDHLDKSLFEVFIARIEHAVALLKLKEGTVGLLDKSDGLFEIIDEVCTLYQEHMKGQCEH